MLKIATPITTPDFSLLEAQLQADNTYSFKYQGKIVTIPQVVLAEYFSFINKTLPQVALFISVAAAQIMLEAVRLKALDAQQPTPTPTATKQTTNSSSTTQASEQLVSEDDDLISLSDSVASSTVSVLPDITIVHSPATKEYFIFSPEEDSSKFAQLKNKQILERTPIRPRSTSPFSFSRPASPALSITNSSSSLPFDATSTPLRSGKATLPSTTAVTPAPKPQAPIELASLGITSEQINNIYDRLTPMKNEDVENSKLKIVKIIQKTFDERDIHIKKAQQNQQNQKYFVDQRFTLEQDMQDVFRAALYYKLKEYGFHFADVGKAPTLLTSIAKKLQEKTIIPTESTAVIPSSSVNRNYRSPSTFLESDENKAYRLKQEDKKQKLESLERALSLPDGTDDKTAAQKWKAIKAQLMPFAETSTWHLANTDLSQLKKTYLSLAANTQSIGAARVLRCAMNDHDFTSRLTPVWHPQDSVALGNAIASNMQNIPSEKEDERAIFAGMLNEVLDNSTHFDNRINYGKRLFLQNPVGQNINYAVQLPAYRDALVASLTAGTEFAFRFLLSKNGLAILTQHLYAQRGDLLLAMEQILRENTKNAPQNINSQKIVNILLPKYLDALRSEKFREFDKEIQNINQEMRSCKQSLQKYAIVMQSAKREKTELETKKNSEDKVRDKLVEKKFALEILLKTLSQEYGDLVKGIQDKQERAARDAADIRSRVSDQVERMPVIARTNREEARQNETRGKCEELSKQLQKTSIQLESMQKAELQNNSKIREFSTVVETSVGEITRLNQEISSLREKIKAVTQTEQELASRKLSLPETEKFFQMKKVLDDFNTYDRYNTLHDQVEQLTARANGIYKDTNLSLQGKLQVLGEIREEMRGIKIHGENISKIGMFFRPGYCAEALSATKDYISKSFATSYDKVIGKIKTYSDAITGIEELLQGAQHQIDEEAQKIVAEKARQEADEKTQKREAMAMANEEAGTRRQEQLQQEIAKTKEGAQAALNKFREFQENLESQVKEIKGLNCSLEGKLLKLNGVEGSIIDPRPYDNKRPRTIKDALSDALLDARLKLLCAQDVEYFRLEQHKILDEIYKIYFEEIPQYKETLEKEIAKAEADRKAQESAVVEKAKLPSHADIATQLGISSPPPAPVPMKSLAIPAEKSLEVAAVAKLSKKVCEKPESQSGSSSEFRGSSGVVVKSLQSPSTPPVTRSMPVFTLTAENKQQLEKAIQSAEEVIFPRGRILPTQLSNKLGCLRDSLHVSKTGDTVFDANSLQNVPQEVLGILRLVKEKYTQKNIPGALNTLLTKIKAVFPQSAQCDWNEVDVWMNTSPPPKSSFASAPAKSSFNSMLGEGRYSRF